MTDRTPLERVCADVMADMSLRRVPDTFAHILAMRNDILEEAARQADLRTLIFGGEPTTINEQLLAKHIAAGIRSLKS